MTIENTSVVDTISKHIVKSKGIGSEDDQTLVDASTLKEATNETLVSLIECFYLIEGSGKMTIKAGSEEDNLTLIGKGKYGLRPDQLKFGDDGIITLSTDSNVESYLIVTEFRRNSN